MSWHYLPELAGVSSEDISLAGGPSAPWKLSRIAERCSSDDNGTACCPCSRSGMMSRRSTVDPGVERWMSSLEDSPVRTSQPPARAPESKEGDPDSGVRWQELSVKFDRNSHSWKTHRCLFGEVLPWSSVILPRWGMMRDGVLFQHPTRERPIDGIGSGLWPTPTSSMVSMADMEQARTAGSDPRRPKYSEAGIGQLNPAWTEWLMGWPEEWTDLKPLATDKFRRWLDSHGRS